MDKYVVLMGDMKDSKELPDDQRIESQKKLGNIVDVLNQVFAEDIKNKISFSRGDSIQGVFTSPKAAISFGLILRGMFFPYQMRFSVAVGRILDMPYEDTNKLDGEAYHNAAKIMENYAKSDFYGVDFCFYSSITKIDYSVNQLFRLIRTMEAKQSDSQMKVSNMIQFLLPLYFPENQSPWSYLQWMKEYALFQAAEYRKTGKMAEGPAPQYDPFEEDLEMLLENQRLMKDHFGVLMAYRGLPSNLNRYLAGFLGVTAENIRQIVNNGNMGILRDAYETILYETDLAMEGQ